MRNAFKRCFDFVVAFCALIVLAPIFVVIAIAVRANSPGPVFYRAVRVGQHGKLFNMYKFRTMQADAGPKVTARDDPRITPLGRLLRDTKLNELPQLFNVLKGEMSLVGPRPEDPEFVAQYTDDERELLALPPGLTSPASVVYYDEETLLKYSTAANAYLSEIMPSKLRLDLLYVRHRSFLLDLDVLFRTAVATLPLYRRVAVDVEEILLGPIQRLTRRYLAWFVQDFVTAFAAVAVAGTLWRTSQVLDVGVWPSLLLALAMAFVFSAANLVLGVQRTAWDYAGLQDALEVVVSALGATAVILAAHWLIGLPPFPAGMLTLAGLFALFGFVVNRYRKRLARGIGYRWAQLRGAFSGRERVLVLGGGEAGRLLVWTLQNSPRGQAFEVVGIVDDDLSMRGVRIHNVRVLGSRKHVPQIVREHAVSLIVYSIHNIAPEEESAILELCHSTAARVVVLPDVLALLDELEVPVRATIPVETIALPAAEGLDPVARETVVGWLHELAALSAAGHTEALERRLEELQAALEGRQRRIHEDLQVMETVQQARDRYELD